MAIDTPLETPDEGSLPAVGTDISNPVVAVIEIDDGSSPMGGEEEIGEPEFSDNLAEYMDDRDLDTIGRKIVELVETDDRARDEWRQTYVKGLDLLGFKTEERTDPWAGACGVYHPVMTEAAVRFQSQAIMEVFPAGGPVRSKIIGKWSIEKE